MLNYRRSICRRRQRHREPDRCERQKPGLGSESRGVRKNPRRRGEDEMKPRMDTDVRHEFHKLARRRNSQFVNIREIRVCLCSPIRVHRCPSVVKSQRPPAKPEA